MLDAGSEDSKKKDSSLAGLAELSSARERAPTRRTVGDGRRGDRDVVVVIIIIIVVVDGVVTRTVGEEDLVETTKAIIDRKARFLVKVEDSVDGVAPGGDDLGVGGGPHAPDVTALDNETDGADAFEALER